MMIMTINFNVGFATRSIGSFVIPSSLINICEPFDMEYAVALRHDIAVLAIEISVEDVRKIV